VTTASLASVRRARAAGALLGRRTRRFEHAAQVRGIDHAHRSEVADTTVLSGDVAAAIGELKAKPAGELQVHGSGNLVRWLLDNQLVDEITLLVYPVVVGQGTRLFPDTGPDVALELVESRSTPKGMTIQVYRPTGRPQARPSGWKLVDGRCGIARLNLVTAKAEIRPASDVDLATLVAILGERHGFTDRLARRRIVPWCPPQRPTTARRV
jgi:RibD C-terminal domain